MAHSLPPHAILVQRQDIVSEDQSRDRDRAQNPEAGRDIPRGTDEHSADESSSGDTGKSAKPSPSGGNGAKDAGQSRTDRDQGR
jgi:hypothetical protein